MRTIAEIASKPVRILSAPASRTHQPAGAGQERRLTPLEEFRLDHLTGEARARLEAAISAARHWRRSWRQNRGRSFVLTGPYGVGKTTILQNLQASARVAHVPLIWSDEIGDLVPDPDYDPIISTAGRFWTATEAMLTMDPARRTVDGWGDVGRGPLSHILERVEVLAIDDLGTEEIPYTRAADVETVRQNRYRELVDYCLLRADPPISLLISSNTPLLQRAAAGGSEASAAFTEIMGGAAWSRVQEAAAGFMFDLSGLPDYRVISASAARRPGELA